MDETPGRPWRREPEVECYPSSLSIGNEPAFVDEKFKVTK
jgi:hypothetical protein